MNFGAHELLETQEALRSKAAHIELYGVLMEMAQDPQLRSLLEGQQRRMMNGYQQGVALLSGRGMQAPMPTPMTSSPMHQGAQLGLHQPMMAPPNPHPGRLSDQTIATLALNMHKTGAAVGMLWAGECVDPQIRNYHVHGANECQQMAYEIWHYMNAKGYYQVAQFNPQTANTMVQAFQTQPMPVYNPPAMQ
ncbi:spore coat protein [Alicyclobacillus sp.]|uniref:spore coat protein n=1 Tax=Alicyclobacillus sp. TaxID=61169 RepID=UPI0025BBE02D|nr:spore coat protein [Alicyclobacillus sp.]MCL6517236.1 spore coat protein [Alicyclobacillus sp.]